MQQYTQITVKLTVEHFEMIRKAADIYGGARSLADYIRRVLLAEAAKVTKQPVPDPEIYAWGRKKKPINLVSEKTGIPVKQLEKAWIAKMAELALKDFTDDDDDASGRKSDIGGLIIPPSERRGVEVIKRRKA